MPGSGIQKCQKSPTDGLNTQQKRPVKRLIKRLLKRPIKRPTQTLTITQKRPKKETYYAAKETC